MEFCQVCGVEAPTKKVSFHQNIGALIMRFSKSVEGNLCKRCINETFWSFTGTNLVLGWWGLVSLIVNPIFIINNTVYYLMCIGLEAPPQGAGKPELTDDVIDRMGPYAGELIDRLNAGEEIDTILRDLSARTGLTTGELMLYTRALVKASREG
ncbi:MAG: hypothetical protein GC159_22555 [Phycisphaera sp.]|nr:hypothetical protein [Phycisphaera sp.]